MNWLGRIIFYASVATLVIAENSSHRNSEVMDTGFREGVSGASTNYNDTGELLSSSTTTEYSEVTSAPTLPGVGSNTDVEPSESSSSSSSHENDAASFGQTKSPGHVRGNRLPREIGEEPPKSDETQPPHAEKLGDSSIANLTREEVGSVPLLSVNESVAAVESDLSEHNPAEEKVGEKTVGERLEQLLGSETRTGLTITNKTAEDFSNGPSLRDSHSVTAEPYDHVGSLNSEMEVAGKSFPSVGVGSLPRPSDAESVVVSESHDVVNHVTITINESSVQGENMVYHGSVSGSDDSRNTEELHNFREGISLPVAYDNVSAKNDSVFEEESDEPSEVDDMPLPNTDGFEKLKFYSESRGVTEDVLPHVDEESVKVGNASADSDNITETVDVVPVPDVDDSEEVRHKGETRGMTENAFTAQEVETKFPEVGSDREVVDIIPFLEVDDSEELGTEESRGVTENIPPARFGGSEEFKTASDTSYGNKTTEVVDIMPPLNLDDSEEVSFAGRHHGMAENATVEGMDVWEDIDSGNESSDAGKATDINFTSVSDVSNSNPRRVTEDAGMLGNHDQSVSHAVNESNSNSTEVVDIMPFPDMHDSEEADITGEPRGVTEDVPLVRVHDSKDIVNVNESNNDQKNAEVVDILPIPDVNDAEEVDFTVEPREVTEFVPVVRLHESEGHKTVTTSTNHHANVEKTTEVVEIMPLEDTDDSQEAGFVSRVTEVPPARDDESDVRRINESSYEGKVTETVDIQPIPAVDDSEEVNFSNGSSVSAYTENIPPLHVDETEVIKTSTESSLNSSLSSGQQGASATGDSEIRVHNIPPLTESEPDDSNFSSVSEGTVENVSPLSSSSTKSISLQVPQSYFSDDSQNGDSTSTASSYLIHTDISWTALYSGYDGKASYASGEILRPSTPSEHSPHEFDGQRGEILAESTPVHQESDSHFHKSISEGLGTTNLQGHTASSTTEATSSKLTFGTRLSKGMIFLETSSETPVRPTAAVTREITEAYSLHMTARRTGTLAASTSPFVGPISPTIPSKDFTTRDVFHGLLETTRSSEHADVGYHDIVGEGNVTSLDKTISKYTTPNKVDQTAAWSEIGSADALTLASGSSTKTATEDSCAFGCASTEKRPLETDKKDKQVVGGHTHHYSYVRAADVKGDALCGVMTAAFTKPRAQHAKRWLENKFMLFHMWLVQTVMEGIGNLSTNWTILSSVGTNANVSDRFSAPRVVFVLPSPVSEPGELLITFYVKYKNSTVCSKALLPLLVSHADRLLAIMNVTESRFIPGMAEKFRRGGADVHNAHEILSRYGIVIVAVVLLVSLLLISLCVLIAYNRRKARLAVNSTSDRAYLQDDMHIAVEFGDLNPAEVILQNEKQDKGLKNGNRVRSLGEEKCWVYIDDVSADEQENSETIDTKL